MICIDLTVRPDILAKAPNNAAQIEGRSPAVEPRAEPAPGIQPSAPTPRPFPKKAEGDRTVPLVMIARHRARRR